jgi:hypothetical protein
MLKNKEWPGLKFEKKQNAEFRRNGGRVPFREKPFRVPFCSVPFDTLPESAAQAQKHVIQHKNCDH